MAGILAFNVLNWREGKFMSYPDRERIESEDENAPELRVLPKSSSAANGIEKHGPAGSARLQRVELAALGWDARRRRLHHDS
jgi:hypothetical protein